MMDCAEEPAWRWWPQGLGMTAGCKLFPLNRTLSVLAATSQHSRAVAVRKCKTVLTQAGLKIQLHPNGTAIEGEWEPVFAAIEACQCPAVLPADPAAGLPNSHRLRPGQLDALKRSLLGVLHRELFAPGSTGEQLWEHGLVSRLLADGSLSARTAGLLALIETPEAMEGYVLRAQGQDDAKRRAQRCITAVQEASRLATRRGWLS